MALRAVKNRSLSDQVFEQLGREIMGGRYPAGSNLPPERALAEIFNVNRHVVREALKRLEQIGVIKISQGGGTRVLDYLRTAGLDALVIMGQYARGSEDEAIYWASMLEMRVAIAADVARLCALRAPVQLKEEILEIARRMDGTKDDKELFELEVHLWDRIHEGAGNLAYRLALNSLLRLTRELSELARQWLAYEIRVSGSRLPIAEAIAVGDGPLAESRTREAMGAAIQGRRGK